MEQCPVKRFSRSELFLFRHDDFILRDGIVGVILIFRRNRTNPQVIPYHRIDWGKTEMLALLDCRTRIFLLQFLPQLRSRFLQIGLRNIEDPENLHLRINIVLFLFVIGEFLVIVILDFLLGLLMDTSERGEHDRKGLLATKHGDTRQFLSILAGLIELLNTIEGAETGNLVPFFLAVQKQHKSIHPVVLAPVKVARPLQRTLGKPRLFPVLLNALDFLDHHFGEQVESLVLAVRSVGILLSVTGHITY